MEAAAEYDYDDLQNVEDEQNQGVYRPREYVGVAKGLEQCIRRIGVETEKKSIVSSVKRVLMCRWRGESGILSLMKGRRRLHPFRVRRPMSNPLSNQYSTPAGRCHHESSPLLYIFSLISFHTRTYALNLHTHIHISS